MTQIITDPDAMLRFAKELHGVCAKLKGEEAALFRELAELGKTWQDPRFKPFRGKIDDASRALLTFHKDADHFCGYLQRKASAAQRILRR